MTTASAQTGSALKAIEYSRPGGTPLYMDAAIPEGSGPFRAAILVHGGAWVRGDRRVEMRPLFAPLSDAGIAWFSIDYRPATNPAQFGIAIDDVRNAILFIKSHAAEYRIDPRRISLVGESAGGQLAAMAALVPAPGAGVNAVAALYTPGDLVTLAKETRYLPAEIRQLMGGTPFEQFILARLGQLSPIRHVTPQAPPFLLIHGTADSLVPFSQSEAMCARLKTAGAACELYPVAGGGHGMRWWESSHPLEAAQYKNKLVRWLKDQPALDTKLH